MNLLQSADRRMNALKENSILSFNAAANYPIDFIEFDVQVIFYFPRISFFLSIPPAQKKNRPDPTRFKNINRKTLNPRSWPSISLKMDSTFRLPK